MFPVLESSKGDLTIVDTNLLYHLHEILIVAFFFCPRLYLQNWSDAFVSLGSVTYSSLWIGCGGAFLEVKSFDLSWVRVTWCICQCVITTSLLLRTDFRFLHYETGVKPFEDLYLQAFQLFGHKLQANFWYTDLG